MKYTGINIQYPVSRTIMDRSKSIETRTYRLPKRLEGKKVVLIETPGKTGKFKARMIGFVVFGPSFEYKDAEHFYQDTPRHGVGRENDQFKWDPKKGKHGWPILSVIMFKYTIPGPAKKGIVYAKDIEIIPDIDV